MKKPFEPWPMTDEAKKKVKEQVANWDKGSYALGFHQEYNLLENMTATTPKDHAFDTLRKMVQDSTPSPRYLGDARRKEKPPVSQTIELDEYIQDLKEFKIVKDVYVLADDRKDDKTLSILIKLTPLMAIPIAVFDKENEYVTAYLDSTAVFGAKEVHVSFQYTEVYAQ